MTAQLTKQAEHIVRERYLRPGEKTADDMFRRVAVAVAKAEMSFGDEHAMAAVRYGFYELMRSGGFLPNSPTLRNAGTEDGNLSACFVASPDDDMASILETQYAWGMIEKSGGGLGGFFGRLRRKGAPIRSTHGKAFGPIAAMRMYASNADEITQGAFRRGAHMGQLQVRHPDIRAFIHAKDEALEWEAKGLAHPLSNFNISVQLDDFFMRAVLDDKYIELVEPSTKEVIDPAVRARELFEELCESAWRTGDPGVVFMDRVHEAAPNPQLGPILSSNPCGEEMLEEYGNCCLGSIDLSKHMTFERRLLEGNDEGVDRAIDWPALADTVKLAVRFLDDVIEVNEFPLPKLREVNLATRRIGLGVMGWADALLLLGIAYDSEQAYKLAEETAKFIRDEAWEASRGLAKERGPFPEWERSALRHALPVRHSSVTTIAPTGTISEIAGCSSGIEPYFAVATRRRALWTSQTEAAAEFIEVPWPAREESTGGWFDMTPEEANDVVRARFPHIRTAHDVSPEAHVRMLAAWQKGTTNSVSKTINLPREATAQDVAASFMLAWELGCKAVTVYRDGSRDRQVLEDAGVRIEPSEAAHSYTIGETDEVAHNHFTRSFWETPGITDPQGGETSHVGPIDAQVSGHDHPGAPHLDRHKEADSPGVIERPRVLWGPTLKIPTGHGNAYINVTLDPETSETLSAWFRGRQHLGQYAAPYEVFVALGKGGSEEASWSMALSMMVSKALRRGTPWQEIADLLRGISDVPIWADGQLVSSGPDAVAKVLDELFGVANFQAITPEQSQSVSQRIGGDLTIEPGSGLPGPGDVGRVIFGEIKRCRECGGTEFSYADGCRDGRCTTCGFSACD